MKNKFSIISAGSILALIFALFLIAGCLDFGCPARVNPVCGEDGVTYQNNCYAKEAGVTVVSSGACPTCDDSDSGRDLFIKGTTEANRTEQGVINIDRVEDSCMFTNAVKEHFCNGTNLVTKTFPCPEGYGCNDGVCVELIQNGEFVCIDTDGGLDRETLGAVVFGNESRTDFCAEFGLHTEWVCKDDRIEGYEAVNEPCPEGQTCQDGACIE